MARFLAQRFHLRIFERIRPRLAPHSVQWFFNEFPLQRTVGRTVWIVLMGVVGKERREREKKEKTAQSNVWSVERKDGFRGFRGIVRSHPCIMYPSLSGSIAGESVTRRKKNRRGRKGHDTWEFISPPARKNATGSPLLLKIFSPPPPFLLSYKNINRKRKTLRN